MGLCRRSLRTLWHIICCLLGHIVARRRQQAVKQAARQPPNPLLDLPPELLLDIVSLLPVEQIQRVRAVCTRFDKVIRTSELSLVAPQAKKVLAVLHRYVNYYVGRGDGDLLKHLLRFVHTRKLCLGDAIEPPHDGCSPMEDEMDYFATHWLWYHTSDHWAPTPPRRSRWYSEVCMYVGELAWMLMQHYIAVHHPELLAEIPLLENEPESLDEATPWLLPRILRHAEMDCLERFGINATVAKNWYDDIRERRVRWLPKNDFYTGSRERRETAVSAHDSIGKLSVRGIFPLVDVSGETTLAEVSKGLERALGTPLLPHSMVAYCVRTEWAWRQAWMMIRGEEVTPTKKLAVLEELFIS